MGLVARHEFDDAKKNSIVINQNNRINGSIFHESANHDKSKWNSNNSKIPLDINLL